MKLYAYHGTLSEISRPGNDIVLGDIYDDNKPPVWIKVNNAMHTYLWERGWTDDEERYITSKWVYDNCLMLQYIEIPSTREGWPAKVIAMADPTRISMEMVIFGPSELIDTAKPEPMSIEEHDRWIAFRQEHNLHHVH